MTKPIAAHDVILRADLPARERAFLKNFCIPITSAQFPGEDLLCLPCVKIDNSHHFYLQVELLTPESEVGVPMQIPHHFVLLISGSETRHAIGFIQQP